MHASSLVTFVAALLATMPVLAQDVGLPGNPEATNPQAQSAPSDKATPKELVGQSSRDAARGDLPAAVKDDVTALHRGPLLMHGNYCGVGNRPGTPPVDLLDAACMHHDSCTKTNTLPSCACNDRLRAEATAVAEDPQTPAKIQVVAATIAASMAVLVCR